MTKKPFEIISAIDVGSNYIRMSVAQANSDGSIEVIDTLTSMTNIGKDAFNTGRISLKTIRETCDTLHKYQGVMKEYGAKKYRAVSTTGMRESVNSEYVIAQIKQRTGLDVEIINIAQERYFVYKALRHDFKAADAFWKKTSMIVNMTSGGIEVSIYEGGKLTFSEYIRLGALRIRETLSNLEDVTSSFGQVIRKYFECKTYMISSVVKKAKIDSFIGLGGELELIGDITGAKYDKNEAHFDIDKEKLANIYDRVSKMTTNQIVDIFKVPKKQADVLLPSLIIYYAFLEMTKAKVISCPLVTLHNGILYDIADRIYKTSSLETSYGDIIASVWYIAGKNSVIKKHASQVEKIAVSIFDSTKKVHKLGSKHRLYLQIAAILHDIGNAISLSNHAESSYRIIKSQSVMGFSDLEMSMIASVAKYHAHLVPTEHDETYSTLSFKDRIVVSKLSAILKLAEALDISHTQKVKSVNVISSDDHLVFELESEEDTLLEEWEFDMKSGFFEEVMGVEPTIRRNS